MIYRFPGSSALRASTPGLKDDDPSGATPLRDRQAGSSLSESGSEAPRQGCSVFSPSVEEGRKPRRRPRDRSAGKNPLDPARVSHYQAYPGSATPCRGRIYYDDLPFPGVFGTSCLDTRAKGRRSLRGSAPAGSAGGVAPRQGCSIHRHRSSAKR